MNVQDKDVKEDVFLLQSPTFDEDGNATETAFRDLGITKLAKQLKLKPEQTNGHWCSRCHGIWFGYTLETQCPVCGNRHG
ncbi:MAG TPA: hypothetical protein PKE69_27635 [Pyrinomonadaceae bacterium]|nr:hypothetical protein [Pyrinomonadaceae bacterium]